MKVELLRQREQSLGFKEKIIRLDNKFLYINYKN